MSNPERDDLPDDPRLLAAVQEYLGALEAGGCPNRQEFLSRYPDIVEPLGQCLDGLELVHQATVRTLPAPAFPCPLRGEGQGEGAGGEKPGDALLPANPLGDFQIIREIGRGGMGIVYEAVQLSLGRRVALKVLPFAAAFDAKHLQRFHHEAQAAAQLHHTNIVPVYYVGSERGVHFYAMQLIDGHSLAEVIRLLRVPSGRAEIADAARNPATHHDASDLQGKTTTTDTVPQVSLALSTQRSTKPGEYFRSAARLIVQAAEALEHAHQFGIVHRDIKPANLLVDSHGRLWITDFGLAQFHADAGLTQTGDILGTLRYMSPEQASGQRVILDHRTDVYSLGATLYELVTLEPIFPGRSRQELLQQILLEEPRLPRAIERTVPVELETIILKAVSKSPAERYGSAREFAADLQRYLDDKPILARRPTLFDRARKWTRRHPGLVAAGVVLLLLCIAALVINNRMIAHEEAKTAKRAAEAEARFQLARRSVDEMIRLANEELTDNPGQQTLRRRLLEAALAYYQEFIEQRRDDPDAQAELAATRDQVKAILADLAVLQGAWQHLLLTDRGVQDNLQLSEQQRARLADVFKDLGERRLEPFHDFHRLTAEERTQRIVNEVKAHEAAIAEILQPAQRARLRQIAIQARGPMAFREPDVVSALKLTSEQREQLRSLEGGMFIFRMERHRLDGPPPDPPPGRPRPPDEETLKATMAKIQQLLTTEQQLQWQDLIGEPFEGPLPRFLIGPPRPFGPPPPPLPGPEERAQDLRPKSLEEKP
jgi:hypothetical protein